MDFAAHFNTLRSLFSLDRRTEHDDVSILPFTFEQTMRTGEVAAFQRTLSNTIFCPASDDQIAENQRFNYIVFSPKHPRNDRRAILLLHGLNERSWDKYLVWADYLARKTGRSVILFPIAFHINRTPRDWFDPRKVAPYVDQRKALGDITNTTFANLAISSRIDTKPLRFYSSALETVYNLRQLADQIRTGAHPAFEVNTTLDFFAYSIGASVAQILLASDTDGRFATSRLFMFCGGSLLEKMNGCQRDIMDSGACSNMTNYLTTSFVDDTTLPEIFRRDGIEEACKMFIRGDKFTEPRASFFERLVDRIKAITLRSDTVVPTAGVMAALGSVAPRMVTEMDFQYHYSHQTPFPTSGNADPTAVQSAFTSVFDTAVGFFV